jgi:arylsulfatase A-like enzyme/Tfp pilus assembly protein PilF
MGRRLGIAVALMVPVALLVGTPLHRTHADRWNVLLVTFDTTRADHLGCYGNTRIRTPTLDRLAADGARFTRALSAAPITLPAHSTIMTGRYPIAHGVRDNGVFVLADEQLTLAEILRTHGYATAAAVGAFPVTARFGIAQGFDVFDDHLAPLFEDYLGNRAVPKQRLFFDERQAAQVNDAILPWLEEHAGRPFFAWVHYFDPHQPFEPPPPFDQLYADDPYDGEIAYADASLDALLARLEHLGVMDRTLVIMTADHGEGLSEHNEMTHATLAYNSTLHVPLIIRAPVEGGGPRGTVVDERVGTVDIVPTILDLLGIDPPAGLQGRSLVPLWKGVRKDGTPPRVVYAENLSPRVTHGWGELRVLVDGGFKYIHGPRPELYDLDADPGELHDLIAERPDDARRLRAALERFLETHATAGASAIEEIDDTTRRRLEALGYLHGSDTVAKEITETLAEGGIPPQDRVGDLNDLSAAKHLLFKGRPAEALLYTEKLVRSDPESPLYLELHASALSGADRIDEAWEVVQRLDEGSETARPLILGLAARRFEGGDERRAVDFLRAYLDRSPSAQGAWLLASLRRRLGEHDLAGEALRWSLEIEPGFAPARVDLAVQLAEAGNAAEAEPQFLRARRDAPYYPKVHYNYGNFLLQSGRFVEAATCFDRAVALAPTYLKAHLALVAAYAVGDERAKAAQASAALGHLAPRSPEAATAAKLLAAAGPASPHTR